MNGENVLVFYEELGFEETEIEDGLTALAVEVDGAGGYVLLTDDEGGLPASLRQPVVLAYYSPEGAYQWSSGFKNSFLFRETWSAAAEPAGRLAAVNRRRETDG